MFKLLRCYVHKCIDDHDMLTQEDNSLWHKEHSFAEFQETSRNQITLISTVLVSDVSFTPTKHRRVNCQLATPMLLKHPFSCTPKVHNEKFHKSGSTRKGNLLKKNQCQCIIHIADKSEWHRNWRQPPRFCSLMRRKAPVWHIWTRVTIYRGPKDEYITRWPPKTNSAVTIMVLHAAAALAVATSPEMNI